MVMLSLRQQRCKRLWIGMVGGLQDNNKGWELILMVTAVKLLNRVGWCIGRGRGILTMLDKDGGDGYFFG